MARTRTVKPEFWSDEKLANVSRDSRLLFVGILNTSDDYGVSKGHPVWLKNQIFPYDDINIREFEGWLAQLEKYNFIIPFNHNGEKYYYIRTFMLHQKVDHPSKYRNPEPPEEIKNMTRETFARHSRDILDETETETETETEFKKASRAREENHHPVDNSIPEPAPESEPEPDIDTTGQVDQDPEIPQHEAAFFENLKATLKKLEPIYTSAYDRRQLMLFAETHKNSKNLDAIIHALNALITAHEKGTTIQNLKRYLDVIVKEESKNYNAAESQRRSDSYKTDPGNLTALGSILDNVHAMRNANPEDIKNRGQTQEQT